MPALHSRVLSPAYDQETMQNQVAQSDQTAQPDQGASSEEDIFNAGSFDQAVEQSVTGEKKAKLETRPGGDVLFPNDFVYSVLLGLYNPLYTGKLYGSLSYTA